MPQRTEADAAGAGTAVRAAGARRATIAGAASLALLGLAGNYLSLPLFFGTDLTFGSVAVFMAIRLFGGFAGVLVAVPASLYTIVLWGHSYTAMVLMLEAVVVSLLSRRLSYLALADALFWLFPGGPLLAALFWFVLGQPGYVGELVVLKQFVNGILNASFASVIVMGWSALKQRRDLLFSELIFNTLVLAILVPGMVLVSLDTRLSRLDLEKSIADKLKAAALFAEHRLMDAPGKTAAAGPAMAFQAAIDRLPVEQGIGIHYLAGDNTTLAKIGNADLASSGTVLRINPDLQIWLPERAGATMLTWWKRAQYFFRRDLNQPIPGSRIVTTYDAQPAIARLESRNLSAFLTLGALSVLTIALAMVGTRILSRPLQQLGRASIRIAEDIEKKNAIRIPYSPIRETNVLADQLSEMANNLVRSYRAIEEEKKLSDDLLRNILPDEIAAELKATGSTDARHFDQVTVLFTDFKGFSQIAEQLSPSELVAVIHACFKEFDAIITRHNLEKIKTIGDSYMCAGGLPAASEAHAADAVAAALEIRDFMKKFQQAQVANGRAGWGIRIGIHTGPVVAGVVGVKKFAYDVWGDTVNTASRMESSGEAGLVNISASTYERVRDRFRCVHRGKIEAKNKGQIDMYFVESALPQPRAE